MTVCDHDIIERAHNRKELREKIAGIIVRKVLQEDYDDLVEGYLDEILMAADEIILLPAYQAVAQTYYDNLAPLSERAELLAAVERMRDKVEGLDSDLRCAVQVAYLRGATEWAKRNYPGMIEWLESCVTARAAVTTGEAGLSISQNDQPGLTFSDAGEP